MTRLNIVARAKTIWGDEAHVMEVSPAYEDRVWWVTRPHETRVHLLSEHGAVLCRHKNCQRDRGRR
jgi:hypothetical protein